MYKVLLILRYLRKRRIAWVSLAAVTLCTAMVLIVISVMGGWLNMFMSTTHALEGDVIIANQSTTGFAHYQQILQAVRKMPQVKAAIAAITTYGMANIDGQYQAAVQVKAFDDLDQVGGVNSFQKGLYRQYIQPLQQINDNPNLSQEQKQKMAAELAARPPSYALPLDKQDYLDEFPGKDFVLNWPGMICGTALIIKKEKNGQEDRGADIYRAWVQLSVVNMDLSRSATPSVTTRSFWIVDDCRTKLYPVDANTVYVPFSILQRDLGMTASAYTQTIGGAPVTRVKPARVSQIEIALNPGVDLQKGRDAIQTVVDNLENQHQWYNPDDPLYAQSWLQRQGQYIDAVVHEKVLLTFLFGIISIVAIFLVFCIFYMIVAEKTRDIGIIKSMGAGNLGVAQIFLGYGLAIGLLGGGLGLLLAYLVVHNINALHAWLGRTMGIVIWDPRTYIFDTIPNTMDPHAVAWIVAIAILSALAGALVPALRASRMNPVEALRWE
jgi:lipoprotein-releasing system permease protein